MKRGFVILATGGRPYIEYAANLAISMKVNHNTDKIDKKGTQYEIALLTDAIESDHVPNVFDHVIQVPNNQALPFYPKTRLYEYSPFEETIYIDADSHCWGSPDDLWERFAGTEFAMYKEAEWMVSSGEKHWGNTALLYDQYKIQHDRPFQMVNSSIIYWRKGKTAENLFRLAEYFYAQEYFKRVEKYNGYYPDEIAFETALSWTGYRLPDIGPIMAMEKHQFRGSISWQSIGKKFPFVTMLGSKGHPVRNKVEPEYKKLIRFFAGLFTLQNFEVQGIMPNKPKAADKKNQWVYYGLRTHKNRPKWVTNLKNKYEEAEKQEEMKNAKESKP